MVVRSVRADMGWWDVDYGDGFGWCSLWSNGSCSRTSPSHLLRFQLCGSHHHHVPWTHAIEWNIEIPSPALTASLYYRIPIHLLRTHVQI